MISITIFLESSSECKLISQCLDEYNTLAKSQLIHYTFCRRQNLKIEAERESRDLWIVGISNEESLCYLEDIRTRNPQVELMVISEQSFDLEQCVIPEIRPLMLCRRPLDKTSIRNKFGSVIRYLLRKKETEEESDAFFFTARKMRRRIRFSRIRYFEARNKKIVLYGIHKEHEFYDSFSQMEKVLGDQFVRCHRSYIVNISYVASLDYGGHYLELCDGIRIPISKKYRGEIERAFGAKVRYWNDIAPWDQEKDN